MRRLTVLAALLTACVLPAQASAHPTVSQALQIAYAADPQAPCARYVSIRWDATLATRGIDGESTGRYFTGNTPEAIRGCIIALDPGLHPDPDRQCDVIVHEVKHLAGYSHTLTGIMQPTVGKWPACHPKPKPRKTKRLHKRFDSR